MSRSCLHCALARALRAESTAFAARGLALSFTRSDPVWLPAAGGRLYRGIRRLLRDARERADAGTVKLVVVDLPGKSHVEVTATVRRGRGAVVLACAFPRHRPGTLAAGFVEGLPFH
jgi:hypothetical protein